MMIEVVVGFGRIKLLMFIIADIKGKDEDIPWKKFIQ